MRHNVNQQMVNPGFSLTWLDMDSLEDMLDNLLITVNNDILDTRKIIGNFKFSHDRNINYAM